MLHDIFSRRYHSQLVAQGWFEEDRRFMVQATMMIREVLGGTDGNGKLPDTIDQKYKKVHDIVARELGFEFLSPQWWFDRNKNAHKYNYMDVCFNFLKAKFEGSETADSFAKARLSFIEQAYRLRWNHVQFANATLDARLAEAKKSDESVREAKGLAQRPSSPPTMVDGVSTLLASLVPGNRTRYTLQSHEEMNATWNAQIHELNERLRLAVYPFHFHNGFLQFSEDGKIANIIHEPFWDLVRDAKWTNVDLQMKEAIDKRDSGDRTAALHAMSALESVIKIICEEKSWATGKEKGAANYVDNLGSKANGSWLAQWECEILKTMFGQVRNPFAHGPGSGKMPELTPQQTNWAIDTAMVWTRTLISRM